MTRSSWTLLRTPAACLLAMVMAVLVACEVPPRFVRESSEIDAYLAQRSYRSACVGLKAQDDSLQSYTAQRLAEYKHVSTANDCLCEALYDAEAHSFSAAVATGLEDTHRDDLAACLAPALDDRAIEGPERAKLVRVLGGIDASSAYEALEALVASDSDPAVRAQACAAVRPSKGAIPTVVQALQSDSDPAVRIACAKALEKRKDKDVLEAVSKAALEDSDGGVRAAALEAVVSAGAVRTDDMVCTAMMDDPDERVRLAAVQAWHGTKRMNGLKCIGAKMRVADASGAVRQAILDALKASPSKYATDLLCDNIGVWSRLYIRDKIAYEIAGADIVRAQNDRDYERSYECVAKALRQGGYSCFARNYLGHWMKDVGGKASTPWCPGMARN